MLPISYFIIRGGLLYYHTKWWGHACNLLVVPHSKISLVMHLAHSHPLGGHLGAHNTLENLKNCFQAWKRNTCWSL